MSSGEVVMRYSVWISIITGLLITGMIILWLITPSIPRPGKLPGDIHIEREHFQFYFPLTTCLLLSLLISGILWLVQYFSR
jgi:hypothetical protein